MLENLSEKYADSLEARVVAGDVLHLKNNLILEVDGVDISFRLGLLISNPYLMLDNKEALLGITSTPGVAVEGLWYNLQHKAISADLEYQIDFYKDVAMGITVPEDSAAFLRKKDSVMRKYEGKGLKASIMGDVVVETLAKEAEAVIKGEMIITLASLTVNYEDTLMYVLKVLKDMKPAGQEWQIGRATKN